MTIKISGTSASSSHAGRMSAATPPKAARQLAWLALAATTTFLIGCSDSSNFDFEASRDAASSRVAPTAAFNPAAGVLPFPNNALFAGSEDGTLNIPVADPTNLSDPQVALNALDGFSTIEPITTGFSQALGAESLQIGSSIRVFEISADPQTLVPSGVVRELAANELAAVPVGDGSTLGIIPLRPLAENTHFMVLVTDDILDANGSQIGRSALFDLMVEDGAAIDPAGAAAALIPLRDLTLGLLQLGVTQGVDPDRVIMAWNFKTQSITPVLQAVRSSTAAGNIAVAPTGATTADFGALGAADVMFGTLEVPYYLDVPSAENPTAALNSFWTGQAGSNLTAFNPQPVVQSTQTIPVLMTVPNAASGATQPESGWPVAIFQHGITRSRADAIGIADAMAQAGFAVVSIDLPLHGVVDTSLPLYQAGQERTFDMDLQDANGAPGPDQVIDSSGTYFYNLQNLLNSRDNFRQAISDLWTLSASVGNLPGIDGSHKAFVGLSLGAIIGSTMLAFDGTFTSATLASPGGGVARLLAGSPTFGPAIVDGLAAAGIDVNSADGQAFLSATQTLMDSGDPVNHAPTTAAAVPVHLSQMLTDNVVTARVAGAALSGTEPLATLMGLPITSTTSSGNSWVRFLGGAHGSIIDPSVDLGVTQELQGQMASFAASRGQLLQVTDSALLEAPE